MTHEDAIAIARHEAGQCGKAYVVYRLPAWPAETYGVRAAEKLLPMEVEVIGWVDPDGSLRTSAAPVGGRLF